MHLPVPGTRYLALISFLALKRYRALPSFFRFTFEIQRQLKTAPGLVGYALDAQPLALRFWTLSVWLDQKSLNDFVAHLPHARAIQALAPHMGKTQFVQWFVESNEIPISWAAAKSRLDQS